MNDPISVALGSSPLKAETSTSYAGGVVLTPGHGLTFSLDVFPTLSLLLHLIVSIVATVERDFDRLFPARLRRLMLFTREVLALAGHANAPTSI